MQRFLAICRLILILVPIHAPLAGAAETGWWWNPAQSGRGFSIETQGNTLFMAGFFYADDGRATWLTSTGAMAGANTYSGALAAYGGGQTLTGAYQAATLTDPNAGTLTLQFADDTHGTLTWPGGTIAIERFRFASGTPTFLPATGWWWNPAEAGRGFFIEVQGGALFMAGYMYDAAGDPVWYAASGALAAPDRFQGHWDRYSGGQTLGGSYVAPNPPSNAGDVTLQFSSPGSATLTLPDGRQIPLMRFGFAPSPALAGVWSGAWANTTFGSSGGATMTVTADTLAQTFEATVDLNGSVFGSGDPAPQVFSGSYAGGGADLTITSALFGNLSLQVTSAGQISGSATNIPGGGIARIDFTGTWTATAINIAYTITFVGGGGTAAGTLVFTKQ